MLLPDAKEIREQGVAEAHKIRYQQWAASHDRSLFARIGIAVPEQGSAPIVWHRRRGPNRSHGVAAELGGLAR